MRWIRDPTGRFAQRPHFETDELDAECEQLVTEFLKRRRGKVTFPISNDDLQVLVEEHSSDLDLYADLRDRGEDVEGVTVFERDARPHVLIARHLSEQPWSHHRLRTTLTHELGHAHFHNLLYQVAEQPQLFSSDVGTQPQPECHRDNMHTLSARVFDTSKDASRVRLIQLGYVVKGQASPVHSGTLGRRSRA